MNCIKLACHTIVAISIVLLTLSICTIAQTTINVPANQPTIQAGISAAQNGDTVMVAPGTYYENINFRGKAITVKSSASPSATIIDGRGIASVVTFNSGESGNSVLSGFTIQDGYDDLSGGGIKIDGASPMITGNVITGNRGRYGIGIDISNGSPVIKNNTITRNTQDGSGASGGGIHIIGEVAAPLITDNTIANNSVNDEGVGGGISADGGSPIIQNNLIQDNTAYIAGGGIALNGCSGAIVVQNIVVRNRSASGAGIYIWVDATQTNKVVNNTIAGNIAYDEISGIYLLGTPTATTITNNIIVAASGQNGVKCDPGVSTVSAKFSYNDVYSATGQAWIGVCDSTSYPGNISADPQFASATNADYHLTAGSAAVDAGDNAAPDLPPTDADKNPRMADGNADGSAVVDMGAFEYVALVVFSPSTLDFSNQEVGTPGPVQTVSLTALVPLQSIVVETTGEFSQTNDCPVPMASGASCTASVTFAPTMVGRQSGGLAVRSSEYPARSQMSMNGNGLGAVLTASPYIVLFQPVAVGSYRSEEITLTNTGNTLLSISGISIDAPFTQTNNCTAPLAPGTGCNLIVSFTPAQSGSFTGFVSIISNAVNGPFSIMAAGSAGYPAVTLSAMGLTWDPMPYGTSSTKTLYVTNSGDAPLALGSISVSGPPFSVQHACPASLAANASCSVSLTFAPTASGTFHGTLTFFDNAGDSPQRVSLSGTAVATGLPSLTLSTSSLTFTDVPVGEIASQSVTLTATSDLPVTISSIDALPAPYSQTNDCPGVLESGKNCTITVSFSPTTAPCNTSAGLLIYDNAAGGPHSINLSGSALIAIDVPADQPTIQAGIDAAQNGDTVLVAPGTYYENLNIYGKTITVKSSKGPSATVIDGSGNGPVIHLQDADSTVLVGFTIQNGRNEGGGGGIDIAYTSPSILGNIIKGNQGAMGAGINIEGGSPEIRNNIITENTQINGQTNSGGGGIRVRTLYPYIPDSPLIIGNTISKNSVDLAGSGGGIYVEGYTSPRIQDNVINDNTAYDGGGGIAVQPFLAVAIVQNIIANNSSGGSGIGGGLVLHTSSPDLGHQIFNNTIVGNRDSFGSSGLYLEGPPDAVDITDNIVVAAEGQYAMYCVFWGGPRWGHIAKNDMYSATSMAWGGECDPTSYADNTSSDPQFVNAAAGDYHLSSSSPVIDLGWDTYYLPSTDADGTPRVIDGDLDGYSVVDLGAFEYMPLIMFSPATLDLGARDIGTTSPPYAVSLTTLVTLQSISVATAGDFSQTNNCPTPMPSGTTCTAWVTFTPTQTGARPGALVVTSSEYRTESSMTLSGSGNGLGAVLTVNPPSVNFDNVVVGTTASRVVTLTSSGDSPVTISWISPVGWPFSQSNNCPTSLPVGASCAITVTFAPTTTGITYSTEVSIVDNAADSPQTVPISGTAIAPVLILNPQSLIFGNVAVGSTVSQVATLTNSSSAAVSISSISSPSSPFSQSNNCPTSLSPGASCAITVTFAPTANGTYSSQLIVLDNAADSQQILSLSGTALTPVLTVNQSSITFNSVVSGSIASQVVTLTSSGDSPVTMLSISPLSSPFSQLSNCPASLPVGASCTITVTFAPTASGTYTATLSVADNATNSPQIVSLSGMAVTPVLAVNPSSLTFSNVLAGTTASQVVTLTSSGDAAVTIGSISAPSAPYSRSTNCPTSLPVGGSCSVTVSFSPLARGTYTGDISISDNALGGPHTVNLLGNAVAVQLSVSPSSLAFGSVTVGTSATKSITVANTGDLPVGIDGVGINSPGFAQSNNCPSSLASGTSCQIDVTFNPTAVTNYAGAVAISDNAMPMGHTVALTGTGLAVGAPNPIDVPADEPTIQAGIDAAQNGDTVLVAPGTYYEHINFRGKAITVKSSSGPAATIIDGSGNGSVVIFMTGETRNSVLSGFTITNGYAFAGGGINVYQTSPKIIGNVIKSNAGCGGIGVRVYFGSPLIQENTVSNNVQKSCWGGTGGAGILIDGASSAEVIANRIESNTNGSASGGGIALNAAGTPSIRNNVIRGNFSAGAGGGIWSLNTPARIAGNLIVENQSRSGGGISLSGVTGSPAPVVTNNTIANNTASDGSAVYFASSTSPVQFENNILVGSADQPTIFCETYAPPPVSNSDIFNPDGPLYGGNCVVEPGSNGNISVDPQFVNAAAGDYHLQASSPAIDLGNNSAADIPATDLDGNKRIVDGNADGTAVVDLGAYEFPGLPVLTVTPDSVNFGDVRVGTTSTQALTLTSSGEQPLTISSIAELSAPYSQTNDCPDSLAVGASCTVTISFTPASRGPATASLAITHNATKGPSATSITGTGVAPVVGLYPASIAFGAQRYGTTSVLQTATLSNVGDAVLNIGGISLAGSGFAQSNNCAATLPAGASCQISVSFSPVARGTFSGTLTVTDDAEASPQQVALSGTGVAPIATFSSTAMTFSEQVLGTTSADQSLTLSNTGDAPLNISGFSASGDFAQSSNCGTSLAPGVNCTINLTFTPTATGALSGSLNITSDSYGTAPVVSLSGTGVMAAPTLSTTSLEFEDLNVGNQSSTKTIKLTANSPGPLSISSITVRGDFMQANNCPAILNPGSDCSIRVQFQPTVAGPSTGLLTIVDNGLGSPRSVALSGTGVQ